MYLVNPYRKHLICFSLSITLHILLLLLLNQLKTGAHEQLVEAFLTYEKSNENNITVTNLVAPTKIAPSKTVPSKIKSVRPAPTRKKVVNLFSSPHTLKPTPIRTKRKVYIKEKPSFAKVIPPNIKTTPTEVPKSKKTPTAPPLSHPGIAKERQLAYLDKSKFHILRGASHNINIAPPAIQRKTALPPQASQVKVARKSTTLSKEILASPKYSSPKTQKVPLAETISTASIPKPSLEPTAKLAPVQNISRQSTSLAKAEVKLTPSPLMALKTPQPVATLKTPENIARIPSTLAAPTLMQRTITLPTQTIQVETAKESTTVSEEILASPQYSSPKPQEVPSAKGISTASIPKQLLEPTAKWDPTQTIDRKSKSSAKTRIKLSPSPSVVKKALPSLVTLKTPENIDRTPSTLVAPSPTRKKSILAFKKIRVKMATKSTLPSDEIVASPQYYSPQLAETPLGKINTVADISSKQSLEPMSKRNIAQASSRPTKPFTRSEVKSHSISPPVAKKTPQPVVVPKTFKEAMTPSTPITPPSPHSLVAFARQKLNMKKIAPTLKRLVNKRAFPGKRTWTSYINNVLLQQGNVYAIAVEKTGEKWFGMEQGLVKFKNGRWQLYTTDEGLVGDKVYAINIDAEGNKWMGTDEGVSRFDGRSWQNFTTEDGLAGKDVRGITGDKQGNQWFATNEGVSRFDGKIWTNYTTSDGLVDNRVYAIAIDRQGKKWFATANGVSCFDGKIWTNYTSENSGLADNMVYAVAIDDSNDKWFGTDNGASRFNDRKWESFNSENGLAGNTVYTIGVNKVGEKWFGTDNGVSRYNDLNWKQYSSRNGLTSNYVFSIASDNKGSHWFGTDSGVSELALQE